MAICPKCDEVRSATNVDCSMCTADQSSVTSRDVSSGSPIGSFSQQPDPAGAIEAGDKRPTERTAANNGRNTTTAGDCEFTPHGDIPLGDATVAFHWSPEALDALDASIGEPVAGRDETPSGSDGLRRRRTDTLIPLTTPNIRAFIEGDEASRPSAVVPTASTASGSKESSSLRQLTRKSMREDDRSQVERQVPKLPHTLSSNRVRPAHETLTDDPSFHSSLPELPPDPGAALAQLGTPPQAWWESMHYVRRVRRFWDSVTHIKGILAARSDLLNTEYERLLTEAGRVTWVTGEALEPELQSQLKQVISLEEALDDLRTMCHRITEAWEREHRRMADAIAEVRGDRRTNNGLSGGTDDSLDTEALDLKVRSHRSEQEVAQLQGELQTARRAYETKLNRMLEELRSNEEKLNGVYASVVVPLRRLGLVQLELGRPKYLAGQFRRLRSCQTHDADLLLTVDEVVTVIDERVVKQGKLLQLSILAMTVALSTLGIVWWSLNA